MEKAVELGGFFAAHGIWSISDGETLNPMVAMQRASEKPSMQRFVANRLEESVDRARERFDANPDAADYGTMVYDGYITLKTGKTDALIVVMRAYANPVTTFTLAVPYRLASSAKGFAVHRPSFLDWHGSDRLDAQTLGTAFFKGVNSHAEGSKVWNQFEQEAR